MLVFFARPKVIFIVIQELVIISVQVNRLQLLQIVDFNETVVVQIIVYWRLRAHGFYARQSTGGEHRRQSDDRAA